MNLPAAGKRRLRATEYQYLLFETFTRGKPRGIIPKVRLKEIILLQGPHISWLHGLPYLKWSQK